MNHRLTRFPRPVHYLPDEHPGDEPVDALVIGDFRDGFADLVRYDGDRGTIAYHVPRAAPGTRGAFWERALVAIDEDLEAGETTADTIDDPSER